MRECRKTDSISRPGPPRAKLPLFYKIGGKTTFAVSGITCAEKMPSDAPAIAVTDPDSVELVRQWILAGAP